ncbi:formin-like protein 14 [Triticum aestivum]|nr:formin-like protein 14 [Triticum aestivum]
MLLSLTAHHHDAPPPQRPLCPLPVSSTAELGKHAVDVVRLRTPLLRPRLTPQFEHSHHRHLPVLLVIPSTPPHLLCYQPPKYAAGAVSATTPLLPPPFIDPAAILPTPTTSTSSSPSPPTLTSAAISEFQGCGSKGEVHDSDTKMGEHGECRNMQGVVPQLLLQG